MIFHFNNKICTVITFHSFSSSSQHSSPSSWTWWWRRSPTSHCPYSWTSSRPSMSTCLAQHPSHPRWSSSPGLRATLKKQLCHMMWWPHETQNKLNISLNIQINVYLSKKWKSRSYKKTHTSCTGVMWRWVVTTWACLLHLQYGWHKQDPTHK